MGVILKNDWADLLENEFQKPYYIRLKHFFKTGICFAYRVSKHVRHF